jgi:hypothetical protein
VDFLRIVRSLEDLLYEVMTWLVFYPRTMWRILVHPAETLRYSEAEQRDTLDEQYTETLSPPLFLMLTVLLAHGVELGLGTSMSEPKGAIGQVLLGSEQNLLLVRSVQYSIYALIGATTLLHRRGLPLDRKTLRGPFYSQCYLTAPFALGLSCGAILARTPLAAVNAAGATIGLASVVWYVFVQALWFRQQLQLAVGRAGLIALWCFVLGGAFNAAINMTLTAFRR